MQHAAAGWRVTAVDQSKKRLERLSENLARTGLSAAIVQDDLRAWRPEAPADAVLLDARSEEHTSELQSLMRTSYAVFCLKKTTPCRSPSVCETHASPTIRQIPTHISSS